MPPDSSAATSLTSWVRRRPGRAVSALIAAVIGVVLASAVAFGVARGGTGDGLTEWFPGADPTAAGPSPSGSTSSPSPSPTPEPPTVTLSAVGDIIMGDAGSLPPDDGAGFFDGVQDALAADLVMGNLEEPLTGDTGYRKCGADSSACHAFRAPPGYAAHLRDGGFDLLNLANNHGNDFGPAGRANTQAALEEHGLAHTGEHGQITVVEVAGVEVAVVGFSPYQWSNSVVDLTQAAGVVEQAGAQADLVVVQAHMGAEGSDRTHVRPGTETFFGEDRGDPMAFARTVVDAGADLVVGHGPHVLRGLEFYDGRLIAYSLGNFAGGGGTLSANGALGQGAVLRVSLRADGSFAGGEFVATHMYEAGLPRVDPQERGLDLVRDRSDEDFGDTAAELAGDGTIIPPRPEAGTEP